MNYTPSQNILIRHNNQVKDMPRGMKLIGSGELDIIPDALHGSDYHRITGRVETMPSGNEISIEYTSNKPSDVHFNYIKNIISRIKTTKNINYNLNEKKKHVFFDINCLFNNLLKGSNSKEGSETNFIARVIEPIYIKEEINGNILFGLLLQYQHFVFNIIDESESFKLYKLIRDGLLKSGDTVAILRASLSRIKHKSTRGRYIPYFKFGPCSYILFDFTSDEIKNTMMEISGKKHKNTDYFLLYASPDYFRCFSDIQSMCCYFNKHGHEKDDSGLLRCRMVMNGNIFNKTEDCNVEFQSTCFKCRTNVKSLHNPCFAHDDLHYDITGHWICQHHKSHPFKVDYYRKGVLNMNKFISSYHNNYKQANRNILQEENFMHTKQMIHNFKITLADNPDKYNIEMAVRHTKGKVIFKYLHVYIPNNPLKDYDTNNNNIDGQINDIPTTLKCKRITHVPFDYGQEAEDGDITMHNNAT